ncbi:alpha-2-macroglobulin-like protein 1 [Hippocampus zosterae]|uniref:alpha-2-macroglobulin-like protein 1 n=1 Tax=Hippocampus zosterae TaxID=109293 RepID=UPI00223E70A5|nr:alpha-2-macroglobulin-like protein 1 [Hippocampus zosterae]
MAPVVHTVAVIFASVFLQSASSDPLNDIIFAVTVSSQVRGGSQETLCALIQGPMEPVALSITLDSTVILEKYVNHDLYDCLKFQVPVVRTRTVATITVTVEGENATMKKKTKILIQPPAFIHIVQTDKPIYKPGQTVQFRIVSMDSNFIPVDRLYTVVELQDPNSYRIAQWLDKFVSAGILDLSHPMIEEATQGTYIITATTDKGEKISHSFDIKEYVLPKFEVTVDLPSVISILDQEVTFKICGKYTYGKPVVGSVKAEFCRNAVRYSWRSPVQTDVCKTYKLETDRSGCAFETVSMADFDLNMYMYEDIFVVDAELEEHGTGVMVKGTGRARFSAVVRTVTFEDAPKAYKPGIAFQGKVKMTGPDNKPVANESVSLFSPNSITLTLITNSEGMASFTLDTSKWSGYVSLKAMSKLDDDNELYIPEIRKPEYRAAYHGIPVFYSKSQSFLKLMQVSGKISCDKDAMLRARYIIQGKELKEGQMTLDFFYLVMSKGTIVQHGHLPVSVTVGSVNKGEVTIPLHQVINLAPFAQVVVYTVLPGGEAVADSQNFPIELCLKNKVSLEFPSVQELPAEKTTLKLQAQPGSLCSVRAIDQSILLLQSERELTVGYVYDQLPLQKLMGYPYEIEDFEPFPCFPRPTPFPRPIPFPEEEMVAQRRKRSPYFGPTTQKNDVYSIFKEVGVKLVTNSDVKKPYDCLLRYPYFLDGAVEGPVFQRLNEIALSDKLETEEDKEETLRTFFPETWIWDLVSVGDAGTVNVEKTVPDTITKWAAGAFCVSSLGFGVAPTTALTVFQPFFISLTLPYSVIRGEMFTLKATVFNYLSKCIMVKVTLAQSDTYTFKNCDECQYTVCLCSEESRTLTRIVTPTTLGKIDLKVSAEAMNTSVLCGNEVASVPEVGRIDTVVRSLLVEAEGTPQSVSHNALLCAAEGPEEKNISLTLPQVFVPGSVRATVSVLGDLMGRAIKNLDQLLAMPYGCGEQNMLLFAPNIFILNYLKSTGQLTAEILDKATRFLESGYQRELTYRHDDGSYSAFGKRDASGNTWLTTFVMKSFGGAKDYIFVDPKHILDAKNWLYSKQGSDGCIQSVGKLFHNGMKGGVSDDVSLTAYVVAALLELDSDIEDPVIQKCLGCLKEAAGQMDNLYTAALMSYTFTLARDEETRVKLITYLHQQSSTMGGTRHWHREGVSGKGVDSLEVEITSYVLLALLSGPALPDFGLDYSPGIVRWLTQQQNPYGGFSSTQDTVVALQALAKYGAATYSNGGRTVVTVTSLRGLNKEFIVDQSNRLLYQDEELSEVPGEYTVRAEGQSCVLAQISMHYNIPPPPDFSAFEITTDAISKCNSSKPQLHLSVNVRYQGRREETNMVIINIRLLSGHFLDQNSLEMLRKNKSVKRVEVEDGYINIYLDQLTKGETAVYGMTLEQDMIVENLKAAVVKVYDYYQPTDVATTEYTSPCEKTDVATTEYTSPCEKRETVIETVEVEVPWNIWSIFLDWLQRFHSHLQPKLATSGE